MKHNSIIGKTKRKSKTAAKISREFINSAIVDYLKKGGKITELKPIERSLSEIMAHREAVEDIDDILG